MEALCVNGKEYRPIKLLGKGKGGYSWLVADGEAQYVLKQIHHEPCEYYTFGDKLESELRDYKGLTAVGTKPRPFGRPLENKKERITAPFRLSKKSHLDAQHQRLPLTRELSAKLTEGEKSM